MRIAVWAAILFLVPSGTFAKVRVPGWKDAPLAGFQSEQDALDWAAGAIGKDLYGKLDGSDATYNVRFQSMDDFRQAVIFDDDTPKVRSAKQKQLKNFLAYFEKDVETKGSFSLHVRNDYITKEVKLNLQKHPDFLLNDPRMKPLTPQQQRKVQQIVVARRIAGMLVAHESRHARQFLDGEIAFNETLQGPGLHTPVAHDRYDEFEGYLAGHDYLKQDGSRALALAETDQYYADLPTKFLVVKDGQETPGTAPFPWPSATDQKTTGGFERFVSGIAAGDAPGTPRHRSNVHSDLKESVSDTGATSEGAALAANLGDSQDASTPSTDSASSSQDSTATDDGSTQTDNSADSQDAGAPPIDPNLFSDVACDFDATYGCSLSSSDLGDFPMPGGDSAEAKRTVNNSRPAHIDTKVHAVKP